MGNMRTTVDLPDALYRRTKAVAALRGSSLKELIIEALEKEVAKPGPRGKRDLSQFPFIKLEPGRVLDVTQLDLDDLLR